MTELFTLILQLTFATFVISCAAPAPLTPDSGTPTNPLAYTCVLQSEGATFIATGKVYRVPERGRPIEHLKDTL